MPATFRSAGAMSASGDASFSVQPPAGILAGDLDFMFAYADAGTLAITADGGGAWTPVTPSGGSYWAGPGTEKLYVWYRIWAGGYTNPDITVTGDTALDPVIAVRLAYQTGTFDASAPIGVVGAASNGSGTGVSHPGITTFADDSLALALHGVGDNGTTSAQTFGGSGTGVTERVDVSTTAGNDAKIAAAEKTIVTAGATGAFAATESLTSPWVATVLEIREFGAPPMTTPGGLLKQII